MQVRQLHASKSDTDKFTVESRYRYGAAGLNTGYNNDAHVSA